MTTTQYANTLYLIELFNWLNKNYGNYIFEGLYCTSQENRRLYTLKLRRYGLLNWEQEEIYQALEQNCQTRFQLLKLELTPRDLLAQFLTRKPVKIQ